MVHVVLHTGGRHTLPQPLLDTGGVRRADRTVAIHVADQVGDLELPVRRSCKVAADGGHKVLNRRPVNARHGEVLQ